jgi:hypothetical protein
MGLTGRLTTGIDHTNNGLSPFRDIDVLDPHELRPAIP